MKRDQDSPDSRKTGRPRTFNEPEVLKKAMVAFWEHGYESTSMTVLTEAMGLNAPSIYSAFGDKKALFLRTLDLYVGELKQIREFVDGRESAYEAVEQTLRNSAIRFTGSDTPRGCLLASSTASCSSASTDVQAAVTRKRAAIEEILRARIERDVVEGILPRKTSAGALAALAIAVIQGMSVLARDGCSRKKLLSLADSAMAAWPAT